MRVSQPQRATTGANDARMMRHFRARARVRYDDAVANDDSDDSDDSDFCARGDATHRTRVRVETIDDDDALVQVRTVASTRRMERVRIGSD